MKAIRIFYSYAFPDEPLRKDLEKHLTILKRQGLITTWHSQEVTAGTERLHIINRYLDLANIILLLVSPDFMASDFCYNVEMQQAMKRHTMGEARVIPIILRSIDWKDAPFGKLQVLPFDGKPIASWSSKHRRDKAFLEVALSLRSVIRVMENPLETNATTSGALAASNELRSEIAHLHINRAMAYHDRGRFDESLAIYDQALLLNPDDPIAHSGKGDLLGDLGRYEEALQAYRQALHLDPDDGEVCYAKARTLRYLGHYEEALQAYEHALHLKPDDGEVYYAKALTLRDLGRYEEALQVCEHALHLKTSYAKPIYRTKARILRDLGRHEEALQADRDAEV
ncbi:MAG: tetratricopeptide repeat protein [Ktedonobacteraceae bacterium]|nr:tetratricopeptide repeat protein [Chloroflexota bacterium]